MAPVIVLLGAKSGLVVPLVAAHLFVFYFGILADDTPPVGLAAFAAAAISGGDPIKTGVQGFMYDIRTALLPFLFIFNTELLLIDVTLAKAVFIFIVAVIAMMLFAAATQGYFLTRNRLYESAALLLIAFTLFRPGFWLDQVQSPFALQPGGKIIEIAGEAPQGSELRLTISGPDYDDPDSTIGTQAVLNMEDEPGEGAARLKKFGLTFDPDSKALQVPIFGSPYQKLDTQFDFYADKPVRVTKVQVPVERIAKEVFYIPALLLLLLVILLQRRRQTVPAF